MVTIQMRMNRGYKYWYLVESKRVNGKPRPIVLECLGPTEKLVARLMNSAAPHKMKSFSHGGVSALLVLAKKLDVVSIINKHTQSQRKYWPDQPIRNDLTSGITLLLAAIGRACKPTSKDGWQEWAMGTSCEHLLRTSLKKLDSQHFWDLMDCIPEDAIEKIELEILQHVLKLYPLAGGTLLYDTTNFFTFIHTTNERCEIAQRGKNKQKRDDLRQVGMAMVVTQEHYIPLLHSTYKGNINDSKVFGKLITSIKKRMQTLNMDVSQHTIVFDRGCNSKANLNKVKRLKLHYVGALTPYHHQDLIEAAQGKYSKIQVGEDELEVYREKRVIWNEERTVLVFVSKRLHEGQLRGVQQGLEKRKKRLRKIQQALASPHAKKRTKKQLDQLLQKVLKGQFMEGLIDYELKSQSKGRWSMTYSTNQKQLEELEGHLGYRIVMTDRHDWTSDTIIKTFYGQATVELAFKNVKNPCHLAVRPQYHWTDQKIKVHYLICVLGYLLTTLVWHDARKLGFNGTLDSLLNILNDIRLVRLLEISKGPGKAKVSYQLEEMSEQQQTFLEAFQLSEIHLNPLRINGVGVYTSKAQ